jgi:hypothetical protein
MPIAETIVALKGALDVSKIVNDLVNRSDIDVVEVRSKVHQMLIHVVNAQTGLAQTQMEIYDLQQQLNDRERLKVIEADLEIDPDGQYYYRKSERSAGKQIQYCPVCWGDKDKLVPLTHLAESTLFECGIHKTKYPTKLYIEALNRQQSSSTRNIRLGRS